jgi:inward rectifier potassium channel
MKSNKKISEILIAGIKEAYSKEESSDFYHQTLKVSHSKFIGIFVTLFLSLNAFFGCLYYFIPGTIAGPTEPSFIDCFSFSVQTMGTVGYGTFFPQSIFAHVLVTLEVMMGLVGIGTFAALAFARISLPDSKLIFSKKLLINEDEGEPHLNCRVAHLRNNMVVNAQISLQLIHPILNKGDQVEMVMDQLTLEKNNFHVMTGAFSVKHRLNSESPLFGKSSAELNHENCHIVATITGIDGTTSEAINHVHSYSPDDIIWNQRFKSIIYKDPDSKDHIVDLTLINEMESSKVLQNPPEELHRIKP